MLDFDVASVQCHRKLLDKYKRQNFPFSPTLLPFLFYHWNWRCFSAELYIQKSTSMVKMKWWSLPLFKLIYSSHLWHDWFSFRTLKYGIVFLLFFTVVTANVYSLGMSGNGKKLTCRRTSEMNTDEIWKCNFPSANHVLRHKLSTNQENPLWDHTHIGFSIW